MTQGALAFALSFFLLGAAPQQQTSPQQTASAQQQAVPDAPAPSGLSNLQDQVTPGAGTAQQPGQNAQQSQQQTQPHAQAPAQPASQTNQPQQPPPYIPKNAQEAQGFLIRVPVNYVDVPVTVRDKHHQLVAGLQPRDFKIYEDGQEQRIAFFTVDPTPLSVAFVIDQSLPTDIMRKVNQSLGALTGAFAPYDSVAVFTYNTSTEEISDFTGSQGPRLIAALQSAKRPGRQMGVPMVDGPFVSGPTINGQVVDPNLEVQRGNAGPFVNLPKEIHPLNDAILEAAKALSKQPKGRRRVIYVITDGKESGSKATQKQVIQYLLTNNISVYGTVVGDSALWGVGYIDKLHMPLLPVDNIMPRYSVLTGGSLASELSENGIQKSFAAIIGAARNQYTLGYYSHQGVMSEKRTSIDVTVDVPGLNVQAKQYYYPSMASMER